MKTELQLQNLKCGGCAKTIASQLLKLNGVDTVNVVPETSMVTVEYQRPDTLSLLKEKLKALGYPTSTDDNGLISKAKSYLSCATGKFG